jgi:predicted Holliday junction resolvase-like endonuclease
MKKLFISQPMKGKTDKEILKERMDGIEKAKKMIGEDVEVMDTFFTDFNENAKPLHFLAKSIEFLADADIVYFASGWNQARGCKIEHQCASEYGIPCIY